MRVEIDLGFSVQFGIFGVKGWEATTTRLEVGGGGRDPPNFRQKPAPEDAGLNPKLLTPKP